MSYVSDWFAYMASVDIGKGDPSFYGLVMAAMRKADSTNAAILRRAFPEVWEDLQARYLAPGGVLESDSDGLKIKIWGHA